MKKLSLLTTLLSLTLPLSVHAQEPLGNAQELVSGLQVLVSGLIPVTFALAFLFFFWGLALFILGAGDDERRAKGKNIMIGGILALFIMATIIGIIDWIGNALGIEQGGSADAPHVEFNN